MRETGPGKECTIESSRSVRIYKPELSGLISVSYILPVHVSADRDRKGTLVPPNNIPT